MATINDIAAMTGISKSTISRYLNGENVKPKTKERIEKAIKETGYEPNSFAQSLKAKHTNLIGIVVSKLDSYANARSLRGFDREFRNSGYQLLITNAYENLEREIEGLYTFAKQKVAGILFFGTVLTEAHEKAFEETSCPIVMIAQRSEQVHCVYHDDYGAGIQLGNYIAGLGHKSVLYFGANENDRAVGVERKKGLAHALEENGISVRTVITSLKMEETYSTALKILPSIDATCLVCATDPMAAGVLKAARVLGKEVPGDFSIAGFGGEEIGEVVFPDLTTVKYPYERAGSEAGIMLKRLLKGEETKKEICLENILQVRSSTSGVKKQ